MLGKRITPQEYAAVKQLVAGGKTRAQVQRFMQLGDTSVDRIIHSTSFEDMGAKMKAYLAHYYQTRKENKQLHRAQVAFVNKSSFTFTQKQEFLKTFKEKYDLSKAELAHKIGCTQSSVSYFLTGHDTGRKYTGKVSRWIDMMMSETTPVTIKETLPETPAIAPEYVPEPPTELSRDVASLEKRENKEVFVAQQDGNVSFGVKKGTVITLEWHA